MSASYAAAVNGRQQSKENAPNSDNAVTRLRVHRPSNSAVEALQNGYASNLDHRDLLELVKTHVPLRDGIPTFPITIDTKGAFNGLRLSDVAISLINDQEDEEVKEWIKTEMFDPLFHGPRGVLILHCYSEDVRDRLYDHRVIILGNEYEFRQKPLCDDLLFVDVIGFHAGFPSDDLLLAFMAVGLKPISRGQSLYEPKSKINNGVLRVYLNSKHLPTALMIAGAPADQIRFGNKYFLMKIKNFSTGRLNVKHGERSPHCLDLQDFATVIPASAPAPPLTPPQPTTSVQPTTPAQQPPLLPPHCRSLLHHYRFGSVRTEKGEKTSSSNSK